MRRVIQAIAVAGLFSAALTACGGSSGESGGSSDPIVIGLLTPLTGPVAQNASQIKNITELQAKTINDAGGVDGRQIEIKTYDTKTDPGTATQQAQRAITQDKVTALIGPYTSSEALAVADVAERSKMVDVNMSAATPTITAGKKFVFRTSPLTTDLAVGMMQVAKSLGATNGALLYDSGGFGLGALEPIQQAAQAEGVTLTNSTKFTLNASDVSAQVAAAAKGDPKAIFVAGSAGADHGLVAKAMAEQGLEVPLIGFSPIVTPDAVKIAGDAYASLPGVYTLQCTDTSNPAYKKLLDAYNAAYPPVENLSEQPIQAAVALDWLAEGLKASSGEGGEALAKALEGLPARETAAGLTGAQQQFTASDHDAYGDNYLVPYKVEDGKPVQADLALGA